jgi:pimeloyl-ACP methyl ester carboxylesterase
MAPVARQLSAERGVLEPLQSATSIEGQLQELRTIFMEYGDLPVTLIGSSWGAMLGFMFSARYPETVKKLILVGSGVYEERYAPAIQETRLSRLTEQEREEAQTLMEGLADPVRTDKTGSLARLGALFTKTDAYDPLTLETEVVEHQYQLHQSVWQEARELRSSGRLLEFGKEIQCPVVAIHGDYDPHPAEGVEKPLAAVVKRFRFVSLTNCGHLPWIEKQARERFYAILKEELA